MNKLIMLSLLLSLSLMSCNEGCEESEAPVKSGAVRAEITVVDQNQEDVEFYSTYIDFQKIWCDGAWSATAVNYGATDELGEYRATSPILDLSNTEDYITVRYIAGSGNEQQIYDDRVSYDQFVHNRTTYIYHTFQIVR